MNYQRDFLLWLIQVFLTGEFVESRLLDLHHLKMFKYCRKTLKRFELLMNPIDSWQ